ncbi:MAG TPA: RpiB/LacA/LacB family sugar-phosphate isomerase [Acidimicrobiales bacterium]
MRIAYGTDESTDATATLRVHLDAAGHVVLAVAEGIDWPDVGRAVGEAVAEGRADAGVVWCWTGTGVVMAATKVDGVRAALCVDAETARGARRWNDANVVGLSLRLTTATLAAEIVDAFLATPVDLAEQRLIDGVG